MTAVIEGPFMVVVHSYEGDADCCWGRIVSMTEDQLQAFKELIPVINQIRHGDEMTVLANHMDKVRLFYPPLDEDIEEDHPDTINECFLEPIGLLPSDYDLFLRRVTHIDVYPLDKPLVAI